MRFKIEWSKLKKKLKLKLSLYLLKDHKKINQEDRY